MEKYRLVRVLNKNDEYLQKSSKRSAKLGQDGNNDSNNETEIWLQKTENVVKFLPKNLQNHGKSITHAIQGQITISDDNNVIYLPSEEVGSSIIDLLRFYTSSMPSTGIQARPIDAFRFGQVLK